MAQRQLFSCIILSICIYACTANQITPYETYETFCTILDNKDYSSAVNMLSHEHRNDLLKNSTPNDFETYFPFLSSVNTFITNETVYYEKTGLFKACLTINGLNEKKNPTTMSLKFLNEKGDWKLDFVHTIYHESNEDFPLTVTCPRRPKW